MTQKLNVSSAVEFDRFIFSVSEFEVGQKKSKKMVQRLRMFLATGKLAFFINKGLAESQVFRETFGKKIS